MKKFKPSVQYDFVTGTFVENKSATQKPKNNANALTAKVLNYLTEQGHFASRLHSTGIFADGRWLKSNQKNGLPDTFAIIAGRFVGFEIKVDGDKPSMAQIKRQAEIKASGGLYEFVGSFDEFIKIYEEILKK